MKNRIIKNWYLISAYIVGLFALMLALGEWNLTQKMLLGSMIFIQFHFFEEFAFPGGFPWVGVNDLVICIFIILAHKFIYISHSVIA